jgi:hypothetical protein
LPRLDATARPFIASGVSTPLMPRLNGEPDERRAARGGDGVREGLLAACMVSGWTERAGMRNACTPEF